MTLSQRILVIWVVAFDVLSQHQCASMQDPHDMFQIFNTHPHEFESTQDQPLDRDNTAQKNTFEKLKPAEAPLKSTEHMVLDKTRLCSEFLETLLKNVANQLPSQMDDRNVDISIKLSLTASDIQMIKQYDKNNKITDTKICHVLRDSFERPSSVGALSKILYLLKDMQSFLLHYLDDLKVYLSIISKFTLKEFVIVSWALVFISCLFFFFILRKSAIFMITWIFICVLFLTTYTTYHKKYQEAVAEREAMMLAHKGMRLPPECLDLSKSMIHLFIERFTGPYPVTLSERCKDFFKKMNIDPEVEIKLMDAFSESLLSIVDKVVHSVFESASTTSEKANQKYGWIFGWLVFVLTLGFIFLIIAQMMGREVSTPFFTVRSSRDGIHQSIPYHRQLIETVPTNQPVAGIPLLNEIGASVSAELIHQLLEKQAQSIKNKRKKNSQQEPELYESFVSSESKTESVPKNTKPTYMKLHSAINLKPPPTRELVLRRSSF